MVLAFHSLNVVGSGDYYTFGTIVFTILIIAMNYRAAFVTRTWNYLTLAAHGFSWAVFILFYAVYCYIRPITEIFEPWMYSVPTKMLETRIFYICALAVPSLAIVVDVFKAYLLSQFRPDRADLLLERWQEAENDGRKALGVGSEDEDQFDEVPATNFEAEASNSVGTYLRSMSSYDWSHAEGGQIRSHDGYGVSHRLSGNTSLVDAAEETRSRLARGGTRKGTGHFEIGVSEDDSAAEDLELAEEVADGKSSSNAPSSSLFAQQKLASFQLEITSRKVIVLTTLVGGLLLLLGGLTLYLGQDAVQVHVQYTGAEGKSSLPWGNDATASHFAPCEEGPSGKTNRCETFLRIPEDMASPIKVLIHLDRFYQNFPEYIRSGSKHGAWPMMTGKWITGSDLELRCPDKSTRMTSTGNLIYPCGLQATSFFNDTFRLRRSSLSPAMDLSLADIAWSSDLSRMKNPPEYSNRATDSVSWLYDRYPTVVSEAEGVTNERFVDWMRPEALPFMIKPMGTLNADLKKGDVLYLDINSSFPVSHLGVTKTLMLMTESPLGGRCHALGSFLVISGFVCWALGLFVLGLSTFCPRRPGDARCRTGMESESEESSDEGDTTGSDTEDEHHRRH
eukprot:TRINITY_DN108747_c0_g1_i1.p1 TRINITY_DN108747_c0_g1~~TRINITY_DN108747_c0_g1_i1.p1  ORF type:complete len:621 (+),score=91.91 TRINITY_DN108747_c0_g1_i1:3-1865(+)